MMRVAIYTYLCSAVFLAMSSTYFLREYFPLPSQLSIINIADAILYVSTAIGYLCLPYVTKDRLRVLEGFGLVYTLFSMLGFILIPSGGYLFGVLRVDYVLHWFHLVIGGLSFFIAWRAREMIVRERRRQRIHHPVATISTED